MAWWGWRKRESGGFPKVFSSPVSSMAFTYSPCVSGRDDILAIHVPQLKAPSALQCQALLGAVRQCQGEEEGGQD